MKKEPSINSKVGSEVSFRNIIYTKLFSFPASEVRNRRRNKNLLPSDVDVGRRPSHLHVPRSCSTCERVTAPAPRPERKLQRRKRTRSRGSPASFRLGPSAATLKADGPRAATRETRQSAAPGLRSAPRARAHRKGLRLPC